MNHQHQERGQSRFGSPLACLAVLFVICFSNAQDLPRAHAQASAAQEQSALSPRAPKEASNKNDDWPMWRYDANRSAAAPHELPADLELQWTIQFSPRRPAWDDPLNLDLMTYDRLLEPIVAGDKMFVGLNDRDQLVAIDITTGRQVWSVFTDGPVRLPPVAWQNHVYFCSDDGWLYCVQVADGQVRWKFHGAPNSQQAIGNRRIISAWPARGGPVLRDGTVYFAASIWPFMGTFIYALDANSGRVQWVNDSTGSQYIKQPHSAPSFAGVAPQGSLVATEKYLVVSGGRSVPAVLDRATGKSLYFEINAGGKGTGGSFVVANEQHFFVHTRGKGTRAFDLATGVKTEFLPNEPVLAAEQIFAAEIDKENVPRIQAFDLQHQKLWDVAADGTGDLIMAGNHLIAGGRNSISLIALPRDGQPASTRYTLQVTAPVERLLAANGRLFAVTGQGQILAFASAKQAAAATTASPSLAANARHSNPSPPSLSAADEQTVTEMLGVSPAEGYAFWFGADNENLVTAMALRSPFDQLAIVDADQAKVESLRRSMDAMGRYGIVTAHHEQPTRFRAPNYVAHMVFVGAEVTDGLDAAALQRMYQSVRPYGGTLHLLTRGDKRELAAKISAWDLEQAAVKIQSYGVVLHRQGALPGSADWTHQYGDVANTIKSNDRRVKLPLGVLWFGGNSNTDVLPRHGHGPPEQVIGGRLFIQGINTLSARDVYTGRVLWKREFNDLGTYDVYFDATYEDKPLDPKYNQVHIPGANGRGTNYVATEDRVYLVEGRRCHVIDPATGKTLNEIQLPTNDQGEQPEWAYIGVYSDVLLGGVGFAKYRERHQLTFDADKELSASKAGFGSKSLDRAASQGLAAFDRHSGQLLWTVKANHSFWHNGIVAGDGKIYCLDKNPTQVEEAMRRRGLSMPDSYRIVALDYRTGEVRWENKQNIFGTWLGYSQEHGLLLHAGAAASDRLAAEVGQGMVVYRGPDGTVQWRNDKLKYSGPCILYNDLIITNANAYTASAGAYYLKTGLQKLVKNPLTGLEQPWTITRTYGCNNIVASQNMLTFRSGAAGFYDLLSDAGTGNLGGFKSGCTSNLVVANGVLNAPDYTRTCSCAYQNQTSLALVHMPDVELWSVNSLTAASAGDAVLNELAINFGAPGDRRDDRGKLWLEYPTVAGDAPPLAISVNPQATTFQHHSSVMVDSELPWVHSSGLEGIQELRIAKRLDKIFNLKTGLPVASAEDNGSENAQGNVELGGGQLPLASETGDWMALRFNAVELDRHTPIRGAYVQFTSQSASTTPAEVTVTIEASGNAAPLKREAKNLSSRKRIQHQVQWASLSWATAKEAGPLQRTPDLSPLIQSVVDHPDWQPGNSLVLLFQGVGQRSVLASKGESRESPLLVVDADRAKSKPGAVDRYDVRLHFGLPPQLKGTRVFDVRLAGQTAVENVTLRSPDNSTPSNAQRSFIKQLDNVEIDDELRVQFVPKQGLPVLNGIELQRRD